MEDIYSGKCMKPTDVYLFFAMLIFFIFAFLFIIIVHISNSVEQCFVPRIFDKLFKFTPLKI
jgi:hypothetical protein